MTRILLSSFLLTTVALPVRAQDGQTDALRLAAACNEFAADLHAQLEAAGPPTCSPGSIAIALLMLLPGAAGATADEIATVLHLPGDLRGERMQRAARALLEQVGVLRGTARDDGETAALVITNDLWVQQGHELVPAYVRAVNESFGADLRRVDFASDHESARRTINAHIAEATNDRIRDLLGEGMLSADTRVVLTNALWFKAAWMHRFSKRATEDRPFTLANGDVVQVPTMRQTQFFGHAESDAWQLLLMSFEDSDVVCELVVPRDGHTLAEAERALLLRDARAKVDFARVAVELPRFCIEASHMLRRPLLAMGLATAFDAHAADFSAMDPSRQIVVDDVVHRTWIQVDEQGCEAAAATALVLRAGSAMPTGEPLQFRADRPFAFGLRDRSTGLLLFVGRVVDPRAES